MGHHQRVLVPKSLGINYLLLRAGWDISGNDDINNYAARTSFGVAKYLWRVTLLHRLNNIGNEYITGSRPASRIWV